MANPLSIPLNSGLILKKLTSIKERLLKKIDKKKPLKIAVLGGSSTDHIVEVLKVFLLNEKITSEFYQSNYNRFYEESVFKNENLKNFNPDIIYIHTSSLNLTNNISIKLKKKDIDQLLKQEFSKYQKIWNSLRKYKCLIIQNNFEFFPHRALGNLDCYHHAGHTRFVCKLNEMFYKEANINKNLIINDINYLSSYIGLEKWFDNKLFHFASYSLSIFAMPYLAHNLSKLIASSMGVAKKCLVLDLDGVLWGGIIGDDGVSKIKLNPESPLGSAHLEFQNYIKKLYERGIILAINSKNDKKNAIKGLEHKNSILKKEYFSVINANWDSKDKNMIDISKKLNIGLDSMVFIDDTATERLIVSNLDERISVPDLGKDITQYIKIIDENKFFEAFKISNEDLNRNKYYSSNARREILVKNFKNYNLFLKSLKMKAIIRNIDSLTNERAKQLINKTNQFNLTGARVTFEEICKYTNDKTRVNLAIKLIDKIGDNGVTAIILGKVNVVSGSLRINVFVMSCRVFDRGLEYFIINYLIDLCNKKKLNFLEIEYIKNQKNKRFSEFFKNLNWEKHIENNKKEVWKIKVDKNFKKYNHFIEDLVK